MDTLLYLFINTYYKILFLSNSNSLFETEEYFLYRCKNIFFILLSLLRRYEYSHVTVKVAPAKVHTNLPISRLKKSYTNTAIEHNISIIIKE